MRWGIHSFYLTKRTLFFNNCRARQQLITSSSSSALSASPDNRLQSAS